MYAILLIFVVSFNLVSSDVANVQELLERVDLLERKLERVDELELKLESLSHAYELLLEDRHAQIQCNCSYLEEDILVNRDMIQKNEAKIEENFEINYGLIQTNKEKTEANKNLINVSHKYFVKIHGKPIDLNQ